MLNIRYFLAKHKRVVTIVRIAVGIALAFLVVYYLSKQNITFDAATMGIIGTLLGAVVGGVFSLVGSVYVNRHQQKAQFEIKRKNLIYKPLYDELVEDSERLANFPYPMYIMFDLPMDNNNYQMPYYNAWRRIKKSTRYLEAPKSVRMQMEKLINNINAYQENRLKVNDVLEQLFTEVLAKCGLQRSKVTNIGEVIKMH